MKTKPPPRSKLTKEMADVRSGKIAPGRVWVVKRRPDGTVDRRQVSAEAYQAKQAAAAAEENTALPARRLMGVSQGRFAEMLGISAATVRNIEQGRTKPAGPTSKLLDIAEKHPHIFISFAAHTRAGTKIPSGSKAAQAVLQETAAGDHAATKIKALGGRKKLAKQTRRTMAAAKLGKQAAVS